MALASGVAMRVVHGERRRAVHLRTCVTCGQRASNGVLAVLLRRSPAVAVLRTDS